MLSLGAFILFLLSAFAERTCGSFRAESLWIAYPATDECNRRQTEKATRTKAGPKYLIRHGCMPA